MVPYRLWSAPILLCFWPWHCWGIYICIFFLFSWIFSIFCYIISSVHLFLWSIGNHYSIFTCNYCLAGKKPVYSFSHCSFLSTSQAPPSQSLHPVQLLQIGKLQEVQEFRYRVTQDVLILSSVPDLQSKPESLLCIFSFLPEKLLTSLSFGYSVLLPV